MKKVQDYVVKGKEVFVGLEDSKNSWKVCIRCDRMIIQEVSMVAKYDVLRAFFRRGYPECQIRVIYEAGFGGFWLHDQLEQDGIDCVVTPPCKVTEEKVKRVKTDRIDARRLAKILESGDYTSCWVPDQELREDRQAVRTLDQIQRMIVATKNRIRKFLDFYGLNGDLPSGNWSQRHYEMVRRMKLGGVLQVCLDAQFELLDKLADLRKVMISELRSLSKKDRYRQSVRLKSSCPGIGWLSAIRFTLELDDLSQFPSGKEFGCYLGLTASEYSSGESIHRGKITRQGKGQLRAWMIECAWTAIRYDPVLLDKFRRVWSHSGRKKTAIVAVARKLAERMRALEKKKEPYQLGVIR